MSTIHATRTATPTKLRNGDWGARVAGTVATGDVVTITTKAGKTWQAEVTRVLWTGADKGGNGEVAICATASLDRPARPRYHRSYSLADSSCGGICPVGGHRCTDTRPCHDCQG